ncbi:cardiotrophin-1 [Eublepharis macularius]|uniref:Cardiotrophin-1 n=1 Tax=Eublepharis macularius TaxID=481883 RepID=A0AA97LDD0_EUBMA|nr:cardiotrophin-1 [Eublepharis macularius]
MEVLPVDLPNLRTSSSHSQQGIASRISQAHHLSVSMQRGSEQLLTEYVLRQGIPFGNADFNPHVPDFPGLPSPALSQEAWKDLSDAERLQQDVMAFSNLPAFLSAVKRQQEMLNSLASELHRQLETAGMQCRGMASNLKSIMTAMGLMPEPAVPVEPPNPVENFSKKLVGYYVCQLYREWANRSEEDLALLATKYPL